MAEKVLGQGWEQRTRAGGWKDHSGSLWGLGHCHIDTAWLVLSFADLMVGCGHGV